MMWFVAWWAIGVAIVYALFAWSGRRNVPVSRGDAVLILAYGLLGPLTIISAVVVGLVQLSRSAWMDKPLFQRTKSDTKQS